MFSKQKQFVAGLEAELHRQTQKAIQEFDFVIKDYVINKQLFQKGIDGNNVRLAGYSRTTIRLKITKGDPVDRTTLRDEGEFYAHIQVDAYPDHFEVLSNVSYDKYLLKRYGKAILVPSLQNMNEFIRNYVLPEIRNKFLQQKGK